MKIYESYGRYYKRLKACKGRFRGMYEWQPMKKVLWFYVEDKSKERFLLDDSTFTKAKKRKRG